MKVAIATLGSRGDVQPFLALALALRRAGHTVCLATNKPFAALADAYGVQMYPLAGDIKEIVGDAGRAELVAAGSSPLRAMRGLRRYVGPMVREALQRLPTALEGCEAVIGQLLVPGAADLARHHGLPYVEAAYVPIAPTRAFAHPGAPPWLGPGLVRRMSWFLAEQVFWQAFRAEVNAFRREVLGLGEAPFLGVAPFSATRRAPALMGYSTALVPRPADWPESMVVTGSWTLPAPADHQPPPRLLDFLASGEPPVYVGFGSMDVDDPEALTREVVRGLRLAGRRGVLSRGYGALAEVEGGDDLITIDDVPHAWLFPRMSAVVHHGGAGTTAAALHAGVPQFIVPFLSDQPFWGHRVKTAGLGPTPVPVGQLTAARLCAAIQHTQQPATRRRAEALGRVARAEPGADGAATAFDHILDRRST